MKFAFGQGGKEIWGQIENNEPVKTSAAFKKIGENLFETEVETKYDPELYIKLCEETTKNGEVPLFRCTDPICGAYVRMPIVGVAKGEQEGRINFWLNVDEETLSARHLPYYDPPRE